MQRALFYTKHTDKFTSSKQNLLVFKSARDQGLLGRWHYNFRHLQHSCSSCAAVLLTCLEDIAQNHSFYCSSCIPEIRTIVLFLLFKSHALRASRIQLPRKFVGQLQEKRLEYYTESRIVLRTGRQEKLYPLTDVSAPLQCHPKLVLIKFENIVHSIFRKENSYLRVLHWQQQQSTTSAPDSKFK